MLKEVLRWAFTMAQTLAAKNVKLHDLKAKFGLQRAEDDLFFREWLEELPALSEAEQQALDRVKRNYLYLLEYPVMESIVKMAVLSPLLDLAGFYAPPFRAQGETAIAVAAEDEGEVIRGNIDVLIIQNQLWITVIEAKNSEFSLNKAIPQALAYMLAQPSRDQSEKPLFGMVLNGSDFLFLKLVQRETPVYGLSDLFSLLNRRNDLYPVLQVLKRFGALMAIA
jgi:Type I restriction enzyme R protein N terminus (HSDR_N)